MKPIVLSNHAEQRRKQRGLTIQQIELTIRNPEYVKILEDRNVAVKEMLFKSNNSNLTYEIRIRQDS